MELLKIIDSLFHSFVEPRLKNSKVVRDFRDKWIKDNYNLKVRFMFKAAVDDAKAIIDLPDDLIDDLLNDKTNREEVFRWILEGVQIERFSAERLNLLPYQERHRNFEDKFAPFFRIMLEKINKYKLTYWEPEFLEIISQISFLQKSLTEGFEKVEVGQLQLKKMLEENTRILNHQFNNGGYEDLQELIQEGKLIAAREKALERIKRGRLEPNENLELHTIVATTYFTCGMEKEAIPYIHAAIVLCENKARKKRLQALIEIFEGSLDKALVLVKEAIDLEGATQANLEILTNVYLNQNDCKSALDLINANQELNLETLKAQTYLLAKEYDQCINLADEKLSENPDNVFWLMKKSEVLVLDMEQNILNDISVEPLKVQNKVFPLLDKLENQGIENIGQLIRIKELRAALLFRNKRFSEAKIIFEEIYDRNKEAYFSNYLSACLCDGDWEKAIELLRAKISSGSEDIDDVNYLARVYVDAGQPGKAVVLLRDWESKINIEKKIPLNYYFTYIDALFLDFKPMEIEQLFGEFENKTLDSSGVNALKGFYFNLIHDWDTAIQYWEQCIDDLDAADSTQAKICLTDAYLNRSNSEDLIKLKQLIPSIPHWMQHEFLLNRYVKVLYDLGEYADVISLSNQFPVKSMFLLEVVTTIYFNLGHFKTAKVNYEALYQRTRDIQYLLRYSNCLFRLGDISGCLRALETAEYRVRESGTLEDLNLLSIAFMEAMQYEKSMEYAYLIFKQANENPIAWKFFFYQFSQLQQFFEDTPEEWVQAYQDVFTKFERKFPDEKPIFKQYKVLEEDGKISNELINQLKEPNRALEGMKNIFQNYRLPISFLITALNKGPFETWSYVVNDKNLKSWIYKGDLAEFKTGMLTAKHSKEVLCDVATLLTIDHLGLLEPLTKRYHLFIYQDHFEKLFEEYSRNKLISDLGLTTLSYQNDKLQMTTTPYDKVKEILRKQEEFIEWVNNNCLKIGNVIDNKSNQAEVENGFLDFILEPIQISNSKGIALLMDSFVISDIAKHEYNVNSFNTMDLLKILLYEGTITKQFFNNAVGQLILMGYALIPVLRDVFVNYFEKHHYQLNDEVRTLFDYIKFNDFDEKFLLSFGASLLESVWLESLPHFTRQQITDYLCNVLTYRKNKSETIQKLLIHCNSVFSPLVEFQFENLKKCLNQWLRAQLII